METLRLILLFAHLLAIAALLGGLLAQLTAAEKVVGPATIWGARLALLIGLLQVGVLEGSDGVTVDNAKIGVKLLVALVVVALLEANRKKGPLKDGLYYAVLGLTVLNVGVAVFWSTAHAVR